MKKKKFNKVCKRCGKPKLKEYDYEHKRTRVCDNCFFSLFRAWFCWLDLSRKERDESRYGFK